MGEAENISLNLNELFVKAKRLYDEIDSSSLEFNSDEFQNKVAKCQLNVEYLTTLVTQAHLFSDNESLEELPTNSIKFLLLPFMLGNVTLKRKCLPVHIPSNGEKKEESSNSNQINRATILRLAKAYFKDFLIRCKDYGIRSLQLPDSDDESEDSGKKTQSVSSRPTPQQLQAMGRERDEKVRTFREKKEIEERIKKVEENLENRDEETQREYHCNVVVHAIISSLGELAGIRMEEKMLKQMANFKPSAEPQPKVTPLRPFLISRDAEQKKVYGAGYPSLPIMTVDEFYEKRVKEGWFPPGSSNGGAAAASSVVVEHGSSAPDEEPSEPRPDKEQNSDDEESEINRERLRQRDEYRDTHRTGWGNTYNRS